MTPEKRAERVIIGAETKWTLVDGIAIAIRKAIKDAFEEAARIADARAAICREAAQRFDKDKERDPYWAASERCAMNEALHIAEKIRARFREISHADSA